jgi:hypothetical protein
MGRAAWPAQCCSRRRASVFEREREETPRVSGERASVCIIISRSSAGHQPGSRPCLPSHKALRHARLVSAAVHTPYCSYLLYCICSRHHSISSRCCAATTQDVADLKHALRKAGESKNVREAEAAAARYPTLHPPHTHACAIHAHVHGRYTHAHTHTPIHRRAHAHGQACHSAQPEAPARFRAQPRTPPRSAAGGRSAAGRSAAGRSAGGKSVGGRSAGGRSAGGRSAGGRSSQSAGGRGREGGKGAHSGERYKAKSAAGDVKGATELCPPAAEA